MKRFRLNAVSAAVMALSAGYATDTLAQQPPSRSLVLEEVIVSARRRDETLQDVPLTVNAVTSEQIADLNLRKFEDLQGVVAGLTLQENSIAANASMRGVRFDTFASGNNSTVEFYLNDAPVSTLSVMQAMFDIGQVEVLRGPQGTLRGRASPSGSITISTQRPVFNEFEGYIDLTATDLDGKSARGALNLPLIEDMLAVRVAGFWEENSINDVDNVFTGDTSEYEGDGYRLSVNFQPIDSLQINAMYQEIKPERSLYYPVESASIANPALPASDIAIRGSNRRAVAIPEMTKQGLERFNLEVAWQVAGQQLNYVFSDTKDTVERQTPYEVDLTNAIDADHPADAWKGLFQDLDTVQDSFTHELRLQSTERLWDRVGYVVGALYAENDPVTDLINPTAIAAFVPTGMPAPNNYFGPVAYAVAATPITSTSPTEEQSAFANVSYLLTDATEVSAGLRRIFYDYNNELTVNGSRIIGPGSPLGDGKRSYQATIYSFSIKHDFTDDLMAYFSYGTSWRPGANAVGDFSAIRSALQQEFAITEPEESDSFEIGVRSTWLDQRLRLNASAYYQDFENSPYRPSGSGVYYTTYSAVRGPAGNVIGLNPQVDQHNFISGVPIEVKGVELEAFFQATERWNMGALFSYAKGEIQDGLIPCNDYFPHDGAPDAGGVPTLNDISAAAGSDNLTACTVSMRANFAPLWTATLTSEYNFPVGPLEGYVRGLWTLYGNSENDPTNPIDDVSNHDILNLYLGLRDAEGRWEVMLYGKNVFDTTRMIQRNADPGSLSYTGIDATTRTPVGSLSGSVISDYREIGLIAPRELGVNVRYHF